LSITYAIGDVHGCLDQLQRLVELCEEDAGAQKVKLILLGDYIDRGPDSRGVIDFLIDLRKWSSDEIVCLRGITRSSCSPQSKTAQTNMTGCEMAATRPSLAMEQQVHSIYRFHILNGCGHCRYFTMTGNGSSSMLA
jgi:hypothetical protein